MRKKIAIIFSFILLLIPAFSVCVSASENTTYSYTLSVDSEWVRTQDAYMPSQILFRDEELAKPSDIFIKKDLLYLSDTENSRILIHNIKTGDRKFIGEGVLKAPKGIFVKDDGTIYVADSGVPAVLVLNNDGTLKQSITRPKDSPLFSSQTVFEPKNVVVTSQNNIFVVGTGCHEGIMQFSENGEFQGFFAANKRNLTLLERIQEVIFTKEQKEQLLKRTAQPVENIDITNRDLVCSVTQSGSAANAWRAAEEKIENRIKLHNMTGTNILAASEDIKDEWNFVDVASSNSGQLYALTYTGIINEYSEDGELIFSFGGRAYSNDRNGLFTMAAAIDVDDNGFIYVLDTERALVQIFYPTDYANLTHEALDYIKDGRYEEGEETWEYILDLNGMSKIAHVGYGKSLFYQQRYSEALNEFKIANDKENYSETFWEIRNSFLNKLVPYILGGLVVIYILSLILKRVFKGKKLIKKSTKAGTPITNIMKDILYATKHPLDLYYDLKRGLRGSVLSATIIYIVLAIVFLFDMLFRGFLFSLGNMANISVGPIMLMLLGPLVLWILGNTMVASINEGEGSFKNIYIGMAYSFAPYLLITPVVVLLSYGVTYNESFILSMIWFVGVIWTAVLIFLQTMYMHDYTVRETIKNVLLTAFFMLMAVVAMAIMYLMWNQLIQFFSNIIGEVIFSVQN